MYVYIYIYIYIFMMMIMRCVSHLRGAGAWDFIYGGGLLIQGGD